MLSYYPVRFLAWAALLAGLIFLLKEPLFSYANQFLAWLCSLIMDGFGLAVRQEQNRIVLDHFTLHIVDRCNGIEPMILLTAALLATRTSRQHKIIGWLIITAILLLMNIIRLISLTIVGTTAIQWYDPVHDYFWNPLFMMAFPLCFLLWLRTGRSP